MKKLLIGILTIFIPLSVICQTDIPQAGIYKSFEEFKNNSPSINFFGVIKSQEFKQVKLENGKAFTEYLLKIPKEESKKIGNIFGFSDGESFYIGSELYNIYDLSFYKLEFIGDKLLYFESLKSGQYGLSRVKNMLNMKTGEISYLTNGRMKKLLKSKPSLYEKFKSEKNKYRFIKEFLIEYQKE